MQECIVTCVDSCLTELDTIWDAIGLCSETRDDRRNTLCQHLMTTCADILRDEKEAQERVILKLEHLRTEMRDTAQCLRVPGPTLPRGLTTLAAIDACEESLQQLREDKNKRLRQLQQLLAQQQELCELMGASPAAACAGEVPTDGELQAITQHIQHLTHEKGLQKAEFTRLKGGILRHLVLLEEATPQEAWNSSVDDEDDVCLTPQHLHLLQNKMSDLEFRVSENLVRWQELCDELSLLWEALDQGTASPLLGTTHSPSAIQQLEDEVSRLRALRLENIEEFVERLREQLRSLWSDCWLTQEDLDAVPGYRDELVSEQTLTQLEAQLVKWRQYDQHHTDTWRLVSKFERQFAELLRLEQCGKDPARLFNTRGGALLQEERERKRVKVELPRIQDKLIALYDSYSERGIAAPFIYGASLPDWIQDKWNHHDTAREQDKNIRKDHKASSSKSVRSKAPSCTAAVTAPAPAPAPAAVAAPAAGALVRGGAGIKRVACGDQDDSTEHPALVKRLKAETGVGSRLPLPASKIALSTHLSSTANNATTYSLQPNSAKKFNTMPRPVREQVSRRPATVQSINPNDTALDYHNFEQKLRSSSEKLNSTTLDKENKH